MSGTLWTFDALLDATGGRPVGPAPAGLGSEWRSVARGVIETAFGPAVMLDIASVIAGPERAAA